MYQPHTKFTHTLLSHLLLFLWIGGLTLWYVLTTLTNGRIPVFSVVLLTVECVWWPIHILQTPKHVVRDTSSCTYILTTVAGVTKVPLSDVTAVEAFLCGCFLVPSADGESCISCKPPVASADTVTQGIPAAHAGSVFMQNKKG